MVLIHRLSDTELKANTSPIPHFSWKSSLPLELRTKANIDVCEYPDSGKINILPARDIFEEGSKVPYYTGEEDVKTNWPEELLKKE